MSRKNPKSFYFLKVPYFQYILRYGNILPIITTTTFVWKYKQTTISHKVNPILGFLYKELLNFKYSIYNYFVFNQKFKKCKLSAISTITNMWQCVYSKIALRNLKKLGIVNRRLWSSFRLCSLVNWSSLKPESV